MNGDEPGKYEGMLNDPAFDALEPERKSMLLELSRKLEGKGGTEAVAIVAEALSRMPKGRELTAEEQTAMISAMMALLPEKDRIRFQTLMAMMK